MYLRTTTRRNGDGSVVRYLALAHNERVQGQTQARVLVNLGREVGLDVDGLRRLVSSISRHLGDPDPYAAGRAGGADVLTVTSSRALGGVWLLDGLWRQLGVDTALRQVLGARRFTTDVERVLFALVANRALDPCSKLAATDWVGHDVAVPGLAGLDCPPASPTSKVAPTPNCDTPTTPISTPSTTSLNTTGSPREPEPAHRNPTQNSGSAGPSPLDE